MLPKYCSNFKCKIKEKEVKTKKSLPLNPKRFLTKIEVFAHRTIFLEAHTISRQNEMLYFTFHG